MDTSDEKNRTVPKGIRFPEELEARIQEIAKQQRRAFSNQVIFMIEEWLAQREAEKREAEKGEQEGGEAKKRMASSAS